MGRKRKIVVNGYAQKLNRISRFSPDIIRDKMFKILEANGIPSETVNAIRESYKDTSSQDAAN